MKKFEDNFDDLLLCFLRYSEDIDTDDPMKLQTFDAVVDLLETWASLKAFKFNDQDIIEIDVFGNVHVEDETEKLYQRIDNFGFRGSKDCKIF